VSDTVVSLLTPPGAGAIATVEVRGPRAWSLAKQLFKPAGKPLPESPDVNRFWFGTLGSDEVVLAVTGADVVEVHCHGGRRVVRWVIEQFLSHSCIEERTPRPSGEGFELLQRAPTLRTASILLDQLNGAFVLEVQQILGRLETDPDAEKEPLRRLAELGNTVGRHLVEPWKVVVAGPPNVGKSSLVNALAGYQRAVVSEVAGTTRDTVSVCVAFDGWPIELIDTAGIREATGLEAEGIARAREQIYDAHLVLWVLDGAEPEFVWPYESIPRDRLLTVISKSDEMRDRATDGDVEVFALVSTRTGAGIAEVVNEIVRRFVPDPPGPGAAVPYTSHLTSLVSFAIHCAFEREWDATRRFLREALAAAE
jgi:tRNA modification GTPase